MKRVLQHTKTGLFVGIDGSFTRDVAAAYPCPNLAAALLICERLGLSASEFVYRMVEPQAFILPIDFAPRDYAA